MRQRNVIMSVAIVVAMAVTASAVNDIHSFGGGVAGTDYDIFDAEGEIKIYNANGIAYAFWAEDDDDGPGTGFINSIILDDPDSMTGNFSLLIADPDYPNDPEQPGALDWDAGDLTYDDGTATLTNIHLAGNLAGGGDIVCDDVTGSISIAGNLASGGNFTCGDVGGDITVGGNMATGGDVICGDVDGTIEVGGDLGDNGSPDTEFSTNDVAGNITISGYLWDDVTVNTMADFTVEDSGSLTVTGDIAIAQGYSGTMTIADAMSGDITVGGAMSGLIDMNRNMVNGSITIGTDETNANLTGEIEFRAGTTILVNGNVSSSGLIDGRTWLST